MKKQSNKRTWLKSWYENCKLILAPVSFVLLIVSAVSYFAIEDAVVKYVVAGGIATAVIIGVVIFLLVSSKKAKKQTQESDLSQVFLREFEKMAKDESNNRKIIEMGPNIAKNLYLTSSYGARIAIAKIVLAAAKKDEGDKSITVARTLINDLGWTTALQNDHTNSEQNIRKGLEIVQSIDSPEARLLEAKATRYLGSLAIANGAYKDAAEKFKEARRICENFTDEDVRKRFVAGICFAEAEMYLICKLNGSTALDASYEKAIQLCNEARKLRQSLPKTDDRHTRYHAQYAKICYFAHKNNHPINKNADNYEEIGRLFEEGLNVAKQTMRLDEIKKNTYGLGCCLLRQNKKAKAKKLIKKFISEYGDVYLFYSDNLLVAEYNNLLEGKDDE